MIFIFIGLIIITLVFFIVNVKKYQYDYMPISIFAMWLHKKMNMYLVQNKKLQNNLTINNSI